MSRTRPWVIAGFTVAVAAISVLAARTLVGDSDDAKVSSQSRAPATRPLAADPPNLRLRQYDFPLGERFTTSIPSSWTADATASGEGAAAYFSDPATKGHMTIFIFHDFVSEPGALADLARREGAIGLAPRPTRWSWSLREYDTRRGQDETPYVGAVAVGHNGNRWYRVSWEAPAAGAAAFGRDVDVALSELIWRQSADSRLVKGEVADRAASARLLRLVSAVGGISTVVEDAGTRFTWDSGKPASPGDVRPGTRVEAVGVQSGPETLLAKRILLYSGAPEIGVG